MCVNSSMAFNPRKLKVTTHKQMQSLSENKNYNDMLISIGLENLENLEAQKDNPYYYFLQSTV
jgi:hypothetical protein